MKRYIIAGMAVLILVGAAIAGSNEGEFTWRKVTGPGPQHVDVITGHGKTCYVFTHQAPETGSVLLWCEESK